MVKPPLKIAPKQPVFRMHMHLNFGSKGHQLVYRDDEMKVQCDVFTPKGGKSQRIFSIDGDKREFKTGAELMAALAVRDAEPELPL